MSKGFRAEVKGMIDDYSRLVVLKKSKQEIKKEIVKVKKKITEINDKYDQHFLVDYEYIPQEEIESGELSFLLEKFTNCGEIFPCTIKNRVIKEEWGWILDGGINAEFLSDEASGSSEEGDFVEDGKYHILLDDDYYAYYLMCTNDENVKEVISILEEDYHPDVEYGKNPPCHVDDCWYQGNSDRVNEWCGSYKLPNMFGTTEIIICGVCRDNDFLADEIDDYGEKIREAYEKHKKEYYIKKG